MPVDLLSFGETFDDFVFHGLPHLPWPGEEIKTEGFVRTVGGGALITACGARRLGTTARVVSALGPESVARLDLEDVTYRNLRRDGEPPGLSVALSTADDRAFVTFEGGNRFVEERLIDALPEERSRHVHGALYPRRPSLFRDLLVDLRRSGATSSWDFGYNPGLVENERARAELEGLLDELDVLFVNELEAMLYSGQSDLDGALAYFADHTRTTVVKRGACGCSWVRGTSRGSAEGVAVEAVDTTGAGDAFDAGYLHAFLSGLPIERGARIANQVGALSTRRAGGLDGLPYAEDLS